MRRRYHHFDAVTGVSPLEDRTRPEEFFPGPCLALLEEGFYCGVGRVTASVLTVTICPPEYFQIWM